MNKTQALAAMDAHLIRVTSERVRRLERRQRYLLRLYPMLRHVPSERRLAMFQEARRYAFRQWSPYVALGVILSVASYLLSQSFMDTTAEVPTSTVLVLIALAMAPGCLLYAHIRSYLRLRADVQREHMS